jgi:hypothetical protein
LLAEHTLDLPTWYDKFLSKIPCPSGPDKWNPGKPKQTINIKKELYP